MHVRISVLYKQIGMDMFMRKHLYVLRTSPSCTVIQGTLQGCKNIKAGGDTIHEDAAKGDMFMTYVVYRSFKYPPPIAARKHL